MEFIHLNIQTSKGSFLNSSIKIPELIKAAKLKGFKSIGIADISAFGIVDFYNECIENDIKPIIGVCVKNGDFDIILYAKNFNGYNNLVEYISCNNLNIPFKGNTDDFICVIPRIGGELFYKFFHSGCSKEAIDNYLSEMKIKYVDLYTEISDNELRYEYDVNNLIIEASKRNKIKTILTGNVFYLKKEDRPIHDLLCRIKYNVRNDNKKLEGINYHFRDSEEFKTDYLEYLQNTLEFDNKIENFSIYENSKKFFMHKFENDESIIKEKCLKALIEKGIDQLEYKNRLEYELSVINKEGFSSYFLLVADVIEWCNNNGVFVGIGRGSAGGSIVSYLLGITGFDPLNKNCPLYFERFLNPDRISPPDIDVDITDRDKVIEYCKDKYGEDKVVNIGTIHTFGTRAALMNIARVYNVNDKELKPIYNVLPVDANTYTNESLFENSEEFKAIINSNALLKNIWQYAIKIEGLYINQGVHASGIIISPRKLNIPVNLSNGVVYTEYDMHDVENLGYIKFDFLGLNTLKIIEKTIQKIKLNTGKDINIKDINYWEYDKKTYELINNRQTICVFQWESDGYKNLIRRLKPDNFNELIDLNTLYRPGPMESGMTELYIERKFGRAPIDYPVPELKDHLKRKGLPLFQEEIMKMCQIMAGFTLSEADMIRKAIGKKDPKEMAKMKQKYIDGCIKTSNFPLDKANGEWDKLEKFQRYSWNLSHGLAYTIISYWTAYLSANYPVEFFAANMDTKIDDHERMVVIINEAKARGITVLPPDVNKASYEHIVENNIIYMTIDSVKQVGEKAKKAIIEERQKNGLYKNFDDFNLRVNKQHCNSLAKEALIYSGVFDQFYKQDSNNTIFSIRYKLLDKIINKKNTTKLQEFNKLNPLEMVLKESFYLGLYITANPVELLKLNIYTSNVGCFEIINIHYHIDKRGNKMCFITATNYKSNYEFVVFSKTYENFKKYIGEGFIIIAGFSPQKSNKDVILNQVLPVYVNGKLVNEYKKFLKPVVTLKEEISNNFDFERYIINSDKNGKIVIYKKEGTNKFYPIEKIVGYK